MTFPSPDTAVIIGAFTLVGILVTQVVSAYSAKLNRETMKEEMILAMAKVAQQAQMNTDLINRNVGVATEAAHKAYKEANDVNNKIDATGRRVDAGQEEAAQRNQVQDLTLQNIKTTGEDTNDVVNKRK